MLTRIGTLSPGSAFFMASSMIGLISSNSQAGVAVIPAEGIPEALLRRAEEERQNRTIRAEAVRINGKTGAPAILFQGTGIYELIDCPIVDFANANLPAIAPGFTTKQDGSQTFVATFYSYDPEGNQIFVIAVGPVTGATAEVDVFITEGGMWGENFDPANVKQPQWGTGTFTASSCESITMSLRPNAEYQDLGYSSLAYDLVRLAQPAIPCPF